MNTNKVRAIYALCKECIEHSAALLESKFYESFWLNPDDAEAFVLFIHEEAPIVLLSQYRGDLADTDAVRRFVYCYFYNTLRRKIRKARQEYRYRVFGEASDYYLENATTIMEVGESARELNVAALAELLGAAPMEVRELCLAFLKSKTWTDAGKSLGWSESKSRHVVRKIKCYFKENAQFCDGFVELVACRR